MSHGHGVDTFRHPPSGIVMGVSRLESSRALKLEPTRLTAGAGS